ncbi:hypothetical protein ACLB1S_08795 [Escherichia coli]
MVAGIWGLRSGAVTLETSQVFAALMGDAPQQTSPRALPTVTSGADGAVDWRGTGRQRRDFSVADA